MATKHEQIIRHIQSLDIGHKISVRQMARELKVSDGTAYRAIKAAEERGLVSTIDRVGTIRIEEKSKDNRDRLTFAEVINVVDGQVLGGRNGLHKTLNKFLIGAMQLEAMLTYTEADSLLIVGNRTKVHELALKAGAAVLITGGFDTEDYIKKIADEKQLPIMSTRYDTYTVASMINRAIYDQMIKREIIFVEDICTPFENVHYLYPDDDVQRWYELNEQTTHARFPVINKNHQLRGMVTSSDIIGKSPTCSIESIMSDTPVTVKEKTSLAFVSHTMVWEGVEIVPVVDDQRKLRGIVSRQDVLKALQQVQHQPQLGETLVDIVSSKLAVEQADHSEFSLQVIPQMTNHIGTLSDGVFTSIITESARKLLLYLRKGDMVVESLTTYALKPVQIDSVVTIRPKILEIGHVYAKIDSEIYEQGQIVGKGLLTVQLIEPIEN